jgi:hypothetical protein
MIVAKQIMSTLVVLSRKYYVLFRSVHLPATPVLLSALQHLCSVDRYAWCPLFFVLPTLYCFSSDTYTIHTSTHRSGKLAFDEKADIDIRGMLDVIDVNDRWEEKSLDLDDIIGPDGDFTEEDSESSYGKSFNMDAGAGLFSTAGLQSFSEMLEKSWDEDDYDSDSDSDDDLSEVISETGDADNVKTSTGSGSLVYKPVKSTSNGFVTAGSPVTAPYSSGAATAA